MEQATNLQGTPNQLAWNSHPTPTQLPPNSQGRSWQHCSVSDTNATESWRDEELGNGIRIVNARSSYLMARRFKNSGSTTIVVNLSIEKAQILLFIILIRQITFSFTALKLLCIFV